MAFSLIPYDQTLIDAVKIEFQPTPQPISGYPGASNTQVQAGNDFGGVAFDSLDLPLQFPPRITSDSKSAIWQENDKGSFEPLLVFFGSHARKVTIEVVYIADGNFTTEDIANATKTVKAYFYAGIQDNDPVPVVKIVFYNHMDKELPADFRLIDVNITHEGAIITDGSGSFPLVTKMTITAALITQVNSSQEIPDLQKTPPPQWY
jgi:hypothetical protein